MVQTRRERLRAEITDEIKAIARRQMAQQGAGSISLRAIANELEITPPALYRYYPSRDDLLFTLVLDSYNSLADSLEAVSASYTGNDPAQKLWLCLMQFRTWAHQFPIDFTLIFGSPIPGFQIDGEQTASAADRVFTVIIKVLLELHQQGRLNPTPLEVSQTAHLLELLTTWQQRNYTTVPRLVLYLGMVGWVKLQGLLTLEIFGHLVFMPEAIDELFKQETLDIYRRLGIEFNPE